MLERRSPLADLAEIRAPDKGDRTAALAFSERALGSLWQIAGWRDFEAAIEPVLSALGLEGLGDYGFVQTSATVEGYRIAPDRIWLCGPNASALEAAFDAARSDRLALLDLSHARVVIRVSGAAVADLMARVAPLDFSPAAFPADCFAQTGIHGVPVLIRRLSDEAFDLLVPVTWAVSVWEWLCLNARPLGYSIEASRS